MKPQTRKISAVLTLMAASLYVAAPGAAYAGSHVSSSPVDQSADAGLDSSSASTDPVLDPALDGTGATSDASSPADATTSTAPATDANATSSSSRPARTHGPSSNPAPSSDPAGRSGSSSNADATSGSTPTSGIGSIFSKISDFFKEAMKYIQPILEFLTVLNSYTGWFNGGLLGGILGGNTGATGVMNGNSGAGTGSTTVGTNVGRNTPTVPIAVGGGSHGHVSTSNASTNGTSATNAGVHRAPGIVTSSPAGRIPNHSTHRLTVHRNPHGAGWYRGP